MEFQRPLRSHVGQQDVFDMKLVGQFGELALEYDIDSIGQVASRNLVVVAECAIDPDDQFEFASAIFDFQLIFLVIEWTFAVVQFLELFLKCPDSVGLESLDDSANAVFLVVVHDLADGDESGRIQPPFQFLHSGDVEMFELIAELAPFGVPLHVDDINQSCFASLHAHVLAEAGEHVPVVVL